MQPRRLTLCLLDTLARAEKVRDYLVAHHGLAAARLQPEGNGASELLNPSRPTAPENRRGISVARPL